MTAKQNPLYARDCHLCGCPLGFGLTNDGKRIPLDLRSPVYAITGDRSPGKPMIVVQTGLAFVTHFRTCPQADQFGKP